MRNQVYNPLPNLNGGMSALDRLVNTRLGLLHSEKSQIYWLGDFMRGLDIFSGQHPLSTLSDLETESYRVAFFSAIAHSSPQIRELSQEDWDRLYSDLCPKREYSGSYVNLRTNGRVRDLANLLEFLKEFRERVKTCLDAPISNKKPLKPSHS